MELSYRPILKEDWLTVAEIYKEGMDTGNATFQQQVPSWDEWDQGHLKSCRILAINNQKIAGWAALSPVSGRCVYAGVAELSVYVSESFRGLKIGSRLLEKLISESEAEEIWTLQAGIFPENISSLKIHHQFGFRTIGYREKIGKMNGVWRDVLLLERRSHLVGLE
ncbi:MAG: N-acetyltransferase [Saprospiraceae bacterium]|nr:N-acetyltransferase [Saprospiraceae bacterium]